MIKLKGILLLALLINFSSCARILGVFNMASYSHFILGDTIFKELAARGHNVTVISPFNQKVPLKNYRSIHLYEIQSIVEQGKRDDSLFFGFSKFSPISKIKIFVDFFYKLTEVTFQNKEVQALLDSGDKFDLVIMESLYNEALLGFGYRLQAPTLILSPGGTSHWINRLTKNPAPYSYIVNEMLTYTPNMTFYQRIHNTFTAIGIELFTHLYALPLHNNLLQSYIKGAPTLYELMQNTSFILVNSYPGFTAPVPLLPNMKEVGGLHLTKNAKLPDDLKTFLDNSKEGVTLFALGSNLKTRDLAPEKLNAILDAFNRWKKPILWKFEDENLPGKSSNIKIAKWLPQADVLAHPNVKAFITHGGRLSTIESIYFGVPIIGFAVFAEQPFNIAQAVYAGYGVSVDYNNFTADDLYNAIIEITSNPMYTEKAKTLSLAMRSRNPLQESIYWIEYVIQFKGAPHLRHYGVNLPLYQYLLVDVILLVVILACTAIIAIAFIILLICRRSKTKPKEKLR